MTVARLRKEMSAAEFHRWWVYYQKLAQDQELKSKMAGGGG